MTDDRAQPAVAYLTKRFPRLSETFILDEILGLEAAGVPLKLYAIADPGEPDRQPDVDRVASPVTYLRHGGFIGSCKDLAATIAAHAELLVRAPRRYAHALQEALRDSDRRIVVGHFLQAGRLAASVRRAHIGHLHSAFAHSPASIIRYTHLLTGLPFSFGAHAKDLYLSDPVHLAQRAADAEFMLVCSSSAAHALAERSGPGARINLIHHGVDIERFRPRDPRTKPAHSAVPTDQLQLLAVGRLVAKKGYPILLQALRIALDRGVLIRSTIVGEGGQRLELELLAAELMLTAHVTFVGARTHQQIASYYRQADVFVQTSVVLPDGDRDGIPNSLLEAMSSAVAVVASDVAGIPEVVHHRTTGLLVEPGSPIALADALAVLADDPALRARLSAGARQLMIDRFDRRACTRQTAQLFLRESPRPADVVPHSA